MSVECETSIFKSRPPGGWPGEAGVLVHQPPQLAQVDSPGSCPALGCGLPFPNCLPPGPQGSGSLLFTCPHPAAWLLCEVQGEQEAKAASGSVWSWISQSLSLAPHAAKSAPGPRCLQSTGSALWAQLMPSLLTGMRRMTAWLAPPHWRIWWGAQQPSSDAASEWDLQKVKVKGSGWDSSPCPPVPHVSAGHCVWGGMWVWECVVDVGDVCTCVRTHGPMLAP